jgi:hypothetical protein
MPAMKTWLLAVIAVIGLASCGDDKAGGVDAAPGGDGGMCLAIGTACTAAAQCCSNLCEGLNGPTSYCVESFPPPDAAPTADAICIQVGDVCTDMSQCCSLICEATNGGPAHCLAQR